MRTSNASRTVAKLNDYMDALANRGYFNGAVLVAEGNKILLRKGYGMANFEHDVPNTPQTKFRIGSLTKGFTAMAVLQLQEQGKLRIDDPIQIYIPDYPNGDIITIHHLLTNTSGIPDYPSFPDYWKETMRLYATIEQTIGSFKDKPLQFPPGEGFSYTSSSYILLGFIIEKTSGISYERYISERICKPLNLVNTGCEDGRTLLKQFASGYSICKGIIPTEYVDMCLHVGAGVMYSTIDDLYLWDRALYRDDLIGKHVRDQLFGSMTSPVGSYGWVVTEQSINNKPRKRVWHNGTMNGFYVEFNRYIDEEIAIIVLSNINLTPIDIISQCLAKIVMGEDVAQPGAIQPLDIAPNTLEKYAGIYSTAEGNIDSLQADQLTEALDQLTIINTPRFAVGLFYDTFYRFGIDPRSTVVVTFEDDRLYLFMQKNEGAWFKYELIPVSQQTNTLKCVTVHIDEQLEFHTDPDGYLRLIHFDPAGNRIDAVKLTAEIN
ncbi:serine hydrolase domain-containing protein [Paenibacillus sp. 2KB_20]|uniref:serine hydrolase domain-containing protein n=1 Tax=Paenibacillus sp. 2KB_20 TaxID=3232977 RepID=UPI003F956C6D